MNSSKYAIIITILYTFVRTLEKLKLNIKLTVVVSNITIFVFSVKIVHVSVVPESICIETIVILFIFIEMHHLCT